MANSAEDMQRLEQFLHALFHFFDFPKDVIMNMITMHQREYKEDPSIRSLMKHVNKGGKIENIEVSKEQYDMFMERMQKEHIDYFATEITKEDGGKYYAFAFKDCDRPQVKKIRDAFATELSQNAKEVDIYTFRDLMRGKEIGVAEGLIATDVYAFRNNATATDLKYVILQDKDDTYKIYASDRLKMEETLIKMSYDLASDKDGKFTQAVDQYTNKRNDLYGHIGEEKPYVIVDAKNPTNFIYCEKDNYSIHSFKKETETQKDGTEIDVIKDGVKPTKFNYENRDAFFKATSSLRQPIIMSASEFELLKKIDKHGKAYLKDEIELPDGTTKKAEVLDLEKMEADFILKHKEDEPIVDKFPVKRNQYKEQDLDGYMSLPPSLTTFMAKQMPFIIIDANNPTSIAFAKDRKPEIDDWLRVNLLDKMPDQRQRLAIEWQMQGRTGDFRPELSGNVENPCYICDPDDKNSVIGLERDGIHIYKNGQETEFCAKDDLNYKEFFDEHARDIKNPVVLTEAEMSSDAFERIRMIEERANHHAPNDAITYATQREDIEKAQLVELVANDKTKIADLTEDQQKAVEDVTRLTVTTKGYEGAIFAEMQDLKANKEFTHSTTMDI